MESIRKDFSSILDADQQQDTKGHQSNSQRDQPDERQDWLNTSVHDIQLEYNDLLDCNKPNRPPKTYSNGVMSLRSFGLYRIAIGQTAKRQMHSAQSEIIH